MLSKDDLLGLGITPGPVFGQVFKAVKAAKTKEEALAIAVAIRDGQFARKERQTKVIDVESVLHWCLENRKLFPCFENSVGDLSVSQVRRMLEQSVITINGSKPKMDDKMACPIWELTFFKGSNSQCSIFFDMDVAPVDAIWMTFEQRLEKGKWVTISKTWHKKSQN